MNNSTNPSVLQSKTWIMNSLVSLMETKDFKSVTISEISGNAGLSRRTFYRNFDSKEDVLQAYFNFLADQFVSKISSYQTFDCNDSLRALFDLCKEHQKFFDVLKRNDLLSFMLNQWNMILPKIHAQLLSKLTDFPKTKNAKSLEYLLSFNVGGTFNMVIKWIDEGMTLSPSELADIVEEFSGGSLIAK